MKRIGIVGAGWFGCHIANKLKDKYSVTLYDQSGIFSKASMNNQNRLHLGYHYARSAATRNMCKNTFAQFEEDYSKLLSKVGKNIYAVPKSGSIIDYETYLKIFSDYDFDKIKTSYLENISGAIQVNEKYIDPLAAKMFFKKRLDDILVIKKVDSLKKLSMRHDLIINCTNNEFNPIEDMTFMQPCKIFLYTKIHPAPFDALTFVDGPLFSIFPFNADLVTVSDVEFTPDSDLSEAKRIKAMEEKILQYYPGFRNAFQYNSSLSAVKAKTTDMSDNRIPVITMENNVINCFSGKIQGIYYLEEYMRNICEF